MKRKYTIQTRIWIKEGNSTFLGPGRIDLLEHIIKTGSITSAAKEMKMSYRQAWQLVKDVNNCANEPLVEKVLGGLGGGGAKVTKAGENAIKVYHDLEANFNKYLDEEFKRLEL